MARSRLDFHQKLESVLGSKNLYFQPPMNLVMQYPCIRYTYAKDASAQADNKNYIRHREYQVVYISRSASLDMVDKLLELPMSSVARTWTVDGLHHTAIDIYY